MSTSQRIACVRVPRQWIADRAPAEARAQLMGALLEVAPRVCSLESVLPRGAPESALGAWADASGMERRGGDAGVSQALLSAARAAGFAEARVGVAGSCVAAAMATRERGSAWRVVPPGRDASFVGRRPLALLPMPDELRASLELLGLRRCGELAALAAADVELRFGAEGVRAWRLAWGEDPRWPFRPAPPEHAAAEAELEPPVATLEPLRFLLRGLIASVVEQMDRRQRIPAALRLVLLLDGGSAELLPVRPARPTADERVLGDLCWSALEGRVAGGLAAPVAGVRLVGVEEGAAGADQLDAFRSPTPDPGAVHAALLPLLARWGEGALSRASARGAHLPAEQVVWEALGSCGVLELSRAAGTAGAMPCTRPDLPLQLRRPAEPRAVRVEVDAPGRPRSLQLDGRRLRLSAQGPQRLSGRWWGDGYAREYWLAEGDDGYLRLLFREGRGGGWYLEAWYD